MASFSALGTEDQRTCAGIVPETTSPALAFGACRNMLNVFIRTPLLGTGKFLMTTLPQALPTLASIETALKLVITPHHSIWNHLTAPRTFLMRYNLFFVDE